MSDGVGLIDVARIVLADSATVKIPLLLQHLGVAGVVVGVDVVACFETIRVAMLTSNAVVSTSHPLSQFGLHEE